MNSIYIPAVDTSTDWFAGAVDLIAERTGMEAVWDRIDADSNTLGDLAGYFRDADGDVYRAEFDQSGSDNDQDRIVFRAA